MFKIVENKHGTTADLLNFIACEQQQPLAYRFVDQDSMEDSRYYEQIIYQDKVIPTRNNSWHDYFNGLIWILYPSTKGLLNQLHWQDIEPKGHQRRTPRRDRMTHFDECGMILLTDSPNLHAALSAHDWSNLFIARRDDWFNRIIPLHFGHANLEMLCQPFIGLTAKAYVLNMPTLTKMCAEDINGALPSIDIALSEALIKEGVFEKKGQLRPLPLLGIPGWHNEAQDATFYANADYFMPLKPRL
ncbi:DUF3025 domain-containing protein [Glaciecola sp. XM2]|uniref:DUF3025 domain-containing protein n=1 Tax=Glaciecola sp. XM2 TaxID=1914931 RepID=UPI001BDDFD21|nr:DUF3025 domain-containing protein [Glaciecola sp. XM2]MBT1450942.1 DUF3025 domain-containing protein [Glaciecola sp. XM2]